MGVLQMLCGVGQTVHIMSVGSNDSAMFWCRFCVMSMRDARKQSKMFGSTSNVPVVGCVTVLLFVVSRSMSKPVLRFLRMFLLW